MSKNVGYAMFTECIEPDTSAGRPHFSSPFLCKLKIRPVRVQKTTVYFIGESRFCVVLFNRLLHVWTGDFAHTNCRSIPFDCCAVQFNDEICREIGFVQLEQGDGPVRDVASYNQQLPAIPRGVVLSVLNAEVRITKSLVILFWVILVEMTWFWSSCYLRKTSMCI